MKEMDLDKAIETVENFLELFGNLGLNLKANEDKVDYYHSIEQDFKHAVELDDMGYHEMAKLTQAFKKSRVERRLYKDQVAWQSELYELYQEKGQLNQAVNLLRNHLGRMRKLREMQDNRIYIKKAEGIHNV